MNELRKRPKLVFFQYRYDDTLPEFLLIHKRDHIRCLEEFFNVTVVNDDCDYRQVCDQHEPELTLFESGIDNPCCRQPRISNARANPSIPKLGLLNADAFSNARAGFISDMERWDIDTFFTISVAAAEHTPDIADRLFVWPNCVNPDVYRNYDERKNIPVLLTGNTRAFYPWRNKIFRIVSERYPALLTPHPGYLSHSGAVRFLCGENYARMINASLIVPACGTVAKDVVRKHLEIPACKACLVSEHSPALQAAGFRDMDNCVFADEHNILDKLEFLFQNPDELRRITDTGYRLVHSKHTYKQRSQILDWFVLSKNLGPGQRIIQDGPFSRPMVERGHDRSGGTYVISNGVHLACLRAGKEHLRAGRYDQAERSYLSCLSYLQWMPEPHLGLAVCNLLKGNANAALSWIKEPIEYTLKDYGATDPDPVEWAYFVISFLCLGDLGRATEYARDFEWVQHPALSRIRWAIDVLQDGAQVATADCEVQGRRRSTVHSALDRTFEAWMSELCEMLAANGQHAMVEKLLAARACTPQPSSQPCASPASLKQSRSRGAFPAGDGRQMTRSRYFLSENSGKTFGHFDVLRDAKAYGRYVGARLLHRIEAKVGYFLPYRLSEMRNDEFFKAVSALVGEARPRIGLVIGATPGAGGTEAFLAGAAEKHERPLIYCIGNRIRHGIFRTPRPNGTASNVRWHQVEFSSSGTLAMEINGIVADIKSENGIESFDAVLIDYSTIEKGLQGSEIPSRHWCGADVIFLHGINGPSGFAAYRSLLGSREHSLFAQNPALRNGYAIFNRLSQCREAREIPQDRLPLNIDTANRPEHIGIGPSAHTV